MGKVSEVVVTHITSPIPNRDHASFHGGNLTSSCFKVGKVPLFTPEASFSLSLCSPKTVFNYRFSAGGLVFGWVHSLASDADLTENVSFDHAITDGAWGASSCQWFYRVTGFTESTDDFKFVYVEACGNAVLF